MLMKSRTPLPRAAVARVLGLAKPQSAAPRLQPARLPGGNTGKR